MYRPKAGDIFVMPLVGDELLSGRILLDVGAQCLAPQRVQPNSQLISVRNAVLVEVHGVPVTSPRLANDRILFPSIFVDFRSFAHGTWRVIGELAVDPEQVDFPPALIGGGVTPGISWGELLLPVAGMTIPELLQLNVLRTVERSTSIAPLALKAIGRGAEIDPEVYPHGATQDLARSDLRLSPAKADLFTRAGLSPDARYFDEALKRGFDLRRFYDPDPRVTFTVCPYCWAPRTPPDICWACGEDTSRDAAIETSQQELDTIERKACPACRTQIPDEAIICSNCRARQPDDDDGEDS